MSKQENSKPTASKSTEQKVKVKPPPPDAAPCVMPSDERPCIYGWTEKEHYADECPCDSDLIARQLASLSKTKNA